MRVQKVKKKTKLKSKKNNSSGNTAAWYRDSGVIQSLAKHNKELGGCVYLVFSNIKVVNLMDRLVSASSSAIENRSTQIVCWLIAFFLFLFLHLVALLPFVYRLWDHSHPAVNRVGDKVRTLCRRRRVHLTVYRLGTIDLFVYFPRTFVNCQHIV